MGQENLADNFTKHHLAAHPTKLRPYYLYTDHSPAHLPRATSRSVTQGCVGTNAHGYGKHTPLPIPSVIHNTWATKPVYPLAYVWA